MHAAMLIGLDWNQRMVFTLILFLEVFMVSISYACSEKLAADTNHEGPESCGIVAPPHTVSVSYLQDESTVTPAFANRQCSEYAKV
jgi:hypothetical protein